MLLTNSVNCSSISSSSIYLQVCSVCKGKFSKTNDWLNHLTERKHQKLARQECLESWDFDRKCCLIVYTSNPLSDNTCVQIVNYFSRELNGALVTDFVWWEDRPHVGILQYESKEKAECIFQSTNCRNSLKVWISDSQYVQVKKGSNLLELEWLSILPPKDHNSSSITPAIKRNSERLSENQTSLINKQDDILAMVLPDDENSIRISKDVVPEAHQRVTPSPPKRMRITDSNNNKAVVHEFEPPFRWTRAKHPLQFEYWNIRKSLLTPNPSERQLCAVPPVENQVSRLFDYLCKFDKRSRYLITMVTNWLTLNYINLTDGEHCNPENSLELSSQETVSWLVIFFLCAKAYIPTPRQIMVRNPNITKVNDKFTIGFHRDPNFVKEWKSDKKKNPTYFKKGNIKKPKQDFSYVIPSDEFSDKFLLSVFQLLWKFLSFYQSTWAGGNEPVASLLDGQIIDIRLLLKPVSTELSDILENKGPLFWRNVMSSDELDSLKIAVKRDRSSDEFSGVYMTHPLLFSHKICLAKDIKISFKHFGNGYTPIKQFVERVEQVGVKVGLMEFGRLRNVLTFKKKDWVAILNKRIIVTRRFEYE